MKLKNVLVRFGARAAKLLGCLSIVLISCETQAQDTFIDGVGAPTVNDQLVIGDFDDGTTQGWSKVRIDSIGSVGGTLQNTNAGGLGSDGNADSYVRANLSNSNAPAGVPASITVGELPGQYNIVQFDLRFDVLPPAPGGIVNPALRGRHFLSGGDAGNPGANFFDNAYLQSLVDNNDTGFHTYTIVRNFGQSGFGDTKTQVRIDVLDGLNNNAGNSDAVLGTKFSIDNAILGRTSTTAAYPAIDIAVPNLIKNGDISATTSAVLASNGNGFDIDGSNGNFGPFQGSSGVVDDWEPYNSDPNGLVPAVADGGELAALGSGSYYLDTHWASTERFSLNSAQGYLNGITQKDILNGVTIDVTKTYELSFDVDYIHNAAATTFTVALTQGLDNTDPATAVTGSLLSVTLSTLTAGDTQTLSISGADLKAAQDAGPVNLIAQSVCNTVIPGFPGSVVSPNHASGTYNCQTRLDNFVLTVPFSSTTGDVNKDGAVTQADVDLAQLYLDGDGGETAAVRQSDLMALAQGPTEAEVLESLNLNDFDLTGDSIFDAADVAAIQALVPATTVLLGDVNLDESVNFLDITPFIGVLSGSGIPNQAEADCDENGVVNFLDITPFIAILSGSGS